MGICSKKKDDYFVMDAKNVEAMMGGEAGGMSREALKEMGMEFYLLFHRDGSVLMNMGMQEMTGTWKNGVMELSQEGEKVTLNYTLKGDALEVGDSEQIMNFARSDETPPLPASERPSDGGKTIEASFADYFKKNWIMSAVCPEGWYYLKMPMFDNALIFKASSNIQDEDAPKMTFHCGALGGGDPTITLEGGAPVEFKVNGRTWKGAYNKDENKAELYFVVEDANGENDEVTFRASGVEPQSELFQQLLASFDLKAV